MWKWGLGEQGAAVSGPFAGAIVLGLNLQRTRASLPCAQAHRSVGQVKGEGAGTPKQRPVPHGRPLSPVEAIHHVASLSSWMRQLPPEGSFLSLACPRSTWWLSFKSYFLLRPLCTTFWMLWGQPHFGLFWSFCIVLGGGNTNQGSSCLILQKLSTTKWGSLEVGFLVQRQAMLWNFPLSRLSRKRKQHASGCLLLAWIKWSCLFSMTDVLIWALDSHLNLKADCYCMYASSSPC